MTYRALFVVVLALAPWPAPTSAQQPARPQPKIDPLTASISGRVTAADTGGPIRRAEVRATSASGINRFAATDEQGRYEMRNLPAGDFRVSVSKSGFVPLDFGQRRPFDASTRIPLSEGERATADVALPRGAAVTGRVVDEAGDPLAGVRLQALRPRTVEGRRRLAPVGATDISDDTGAFRLHGLPPGEYYVAATPQEARFPEVPRGALPDSMPPGASVGPRQTMTIFYPGTPNLDEAQRITIAVGGEARADMQLGRIGAATVSGIIVDSSGSPAADALVSLRSELVDLGPSPLAITGHAGPDGRFELTNIPPGSYSLHASTAIRSVAPPSSGGAMTMPTTEAAEMPLLIPAAGVAGLTVTTRQGGTIDAAVVADAAVGQPLPSGFTLSVRSLSPGGMHSLRTGGARNEFRLAGLHGPVHLQLEQLPPEWAIKAILVDGVDRTDEPIDVRGRNASVRVVLTDRVTEVTGSVTRDSPASSDARRRDTVVVFPADPTKWPYPSRYVRTVRADQGGAFRVTGLPGNERYLAVAVDFLEDGEGTDPEFFERMQDRAVSFTLSEGERRSIALRSIER